MVKSFKNLLQNQKADYLGTWHLGDEAYQICSNDDPRLTLTYLTSRSNLLPFETNRKNDFLNTVEAKVIILT